MTDINDNENNIDLCIKEAGIPIFVKADEKIAIDPRDDLNAETEIGVFTGLRTDDGGFGLVTSAWQLPAMTEKCNSHV